MKLSVIIPTLNEAERIRDCIRSVKRLTPFEIIVVDGGSTDKTIEIAKDEGVTVVLSPRGRGIQLSRGSVYAKGDILMFVHADGILDDKVNFKDIHDAIRDENVGGFFKLRFDQKNFSIRLVETFANWRSLLFNLPYGDQAIFVTKTAYDAIDGFRQYPFLEDLDFILRLRKLGKLKRLNGCITVSSRRILKGYPLSPILVSQRNLLIAFLFMMGIKPAGLTWMYK
ncbi:MAG TPA: glycosyltransferase family 2 protein [Nitrospirae bacterium]|nr:glycosyltransferase family 2 protein [Nitrospirota bacterium]